MVLLAVVLAAYANHFHNSFHMDDAPAIVNNAHVAQIQPAAQGVVPAGCVVSHKARMEKSTKK